MKVVIDISPLRSAHKTRGIGIYTRYLVENLQRVDTENEYVLTSKPERLKVDLVHYPYFDFFFPTLPLVKRIPTVVTIHDTIPLIFPDKYRPGIRGKLVFYRQKYALNGVKAIVTDSDNSRKDIAKYLQQPIEKVYPVYLAANRQFKPASEAAKKKVRLKYQLPERFILYVGDINYNKNLPRLIEALARIKTKVSLVVVAQSLKNDKLKEAQEIFQAVDQWGLKDRFKAVTDVSFDPVDDLVAIYSAAQVYIQPSLYEGFGLPVLEAFQCGVPVVASQVASLPEVAGKAAIFVNPEEVESIASGLSKALGLSSTERRKLINEGKEQASKFSWEQTAKETVKVYRQALI